MRELYALERHDRQELEQRYLQAMVERDSARAERDALRLSLAEHLQKRVALEVELDALKLRNDPLLNTEAGFETRDGAHAKAHAKAKRAQTMAANGDAGSTASHPAPAIAVSATTWHQVRLVSLLGAAALAVTAFDVIRGGLHLGLSALAGALSSIVGSCVGCCIAACFAPRDPSLLSQAFYARMYASSELSSDLTALALSFAAAAALSVTISGLAAWSMHRYPPDARTRMLWVLNVGLACLFASRHMRRAWRGCTQIGRLRLTVGQEGYDDRGDSDDCCRCVLCLDGDRAANELDERSSLCETIFGSRKKWLSLF